MRRQAGRQAADPHRELQALKEGARIEHIRGDGLLELLVGGLDQLPAGETLRQPRPLLDQPGSRRLVELHHNLYVLRHGGAAPPLKIRGLLEHESAGSREVRQLEISEAVELYMQAPARRQTAPTQGLRVGEAQAQARSQRAARWAKRPRSRPTSSPTARGSGTRPHHPCCHRRAG